MDYLIPSVEQLDLAATMLDKANPIKSRLALILVDNIVELLMHNKCEEEVYLDCLYTRHETRRITRKDRENALGKVFAEKAKALTKWGRLSEAERDYILLAHSFRNEAYHLGVMRNDFIFELVWVYHGIACELFFKLRPGTHRIPLEKDLSDISRKYFLFDSKSVGVDWPGVVQLLKDARPVLTVSLQEALSASLAKRLENIADGLKFIADNDDCQRYKDYPQLQKNDKNIVLTDKTGNWQVAVPIKVFTRWMKRAREVAKSKVEEVAMGRYVSLEREFQPFEELCRNVVAQIDAEIQHRADYMRGK